MKFSERYFSFPVRIYDRFTMNKAEKQEEEEGTPVEGDWVAGRARFPYEDISSWSDFYDSKQGVDGVLKDGYEYTLIFTYTGKAVICIWPMKKFEEKLDEYVEKLEAWQKQKIEDELKRFDENHKDAL